MKKIHNMYILAFLCSYCSSKKIDTFLIPNGRCTIADTWKRRSTDATLYKELWMNCDYYIIEYDYSARDIKPPLFWVLFLYIISLDYFIKVSLKLMWEVNFRNGHFWCDLNTTLPLQEETGFEHWLNNTHLLLLPKQK